MARKKTAPGMIPSEYPAYPTAVRSRLTDGRLVAINGGVWLYFSVPLNPVVDAPTTADKIAAARPLASALRELSDMARVNITRRSAARGSYRQVHLLLVNVPGPYMAPASSPIAPYLQEQYGDQTINHRVALVGVQLKESTGTGSSSGISAAVNYVWQTLVTGMVPLENFEQDANKIRQAMGRSGLMPASEKQLELALGWWDDQQRSDVPVLEHVDHLHVFADGEQARLASTLGGDCDHEEWGIIDQHAFSFLSVQGFDFHETDAVSADALWVSNLIEANVSAISIRGGIEPAKITREELRRRLKMARSDAEEAAEAGKMARGEMEEQLEELSYYEHAYSLSDAPPVLTDASVIAVANGRITDPADFAQGLRMTLHSLDFRQLASWAETQMASPVRANPHLHDIPIHTVALSGFPSISKVGDTSGAMLGFTELDRQPAMVSPGAASKTDSEPLFVVPGTTGSGKLLTLDTPIPTPTGQTTMGHLAVGDYVYGRDGSPTRVIYVSPINETPNLYRVTFSDGQTLDADANHQWVVIDRSQRREGLSMARGRWQDQVKLLERVGTTWDGNDHLSATDIFKNLIDETSDDTALPWESPDHMESVLAFLEVPSDDHGRYDPSFVAQALAERLRQSWSEVSSGGYLESRITTGEMVSTNLVMRDDSFRYAIGLPSAIGYPTKDYEIDPMEAGLAVARRVSDFDSAYAQGDLRQRSDFIMGLFGAVEKSVVLSNDNALKVVKMTRAIGLSTTITHLSDNAPAHLIPPGLEGPSQPDIVLGDGYARVTLTGARTLDIVSIEPIETRPGRCIQVDNADRVYLAGDYIPTSNTMVMLLLADQFARAGHPVVIVDPKQESHHDSVVLASGGQIASLDDLIQSDGVFDPLRFSRNVSVGVEIAQSMLSFINPWGNELPNVESELMSGLRYGVESGATCTGQALKIAYDNGVIEKSTWHKFEQLLNSSPMFRACAGVNPTGQGLSVASGITLVKVGESNLDLPAPGLPTSEMSIPQKITMTLVKNMVFGSASALMNRNPSGVVMLDEAWVFLGAGKSEVERLGRLARSQNVLPMLFTQRVSDAVKADLIPYISRGIILPIKDENEARAACELFRLEPTPERIERITDMATTGGVDSDDEYGAPNWNSMRHLRDGQGNTIRGTIGIYADLAGRAVPVEIVIPPDFLALASTNPDDIRRRLERERAEKLAIEGNAGGAFADAESPPRAIAAGSDGSGFEMPSANPLENQGDQRIDPDGPGAPGDYDDDPDPDDDGYDDYADEYDDDEPEDDSTAAVFSDW